MLPIAGRGSATWKVTIRREGPPVHEVMRPRHEPSVIAAGAELVARLGRLDRISPPRPHPICGAASVFIGQFHAGEIYNQYPQSALARRDAALAAGHGSIGASSATSGAAGRSRRRHRDDHQLRMDVYPRCLRSRSGRPAGGSVSKLLSGDIGRHFIAHGAQAVCRRRQQLSAPTPASRRSRMARARGASTPLSEWVEIDDLVRVAWLYAAIAVEYCRG